MTIFTKETDFLNALRKSSYSMEKLPDEITIPALRDGDEA